MKVVPLWLEKSLAVVRRRQRGKTKNIPAVQQLWSVQKLCWAKSFKPNYECDGILCYVIITIIILLQQYLTILMEYEWFVVDGDCGKNMSSLVFNDLMPVFICCLWWRTQDNKKADFAMRRLTIFAVDNLMPHRREKRAYTRLIFHWHRSHWRRLASGMCDGWPIWHTSFRRTARLIVLCICAMNDRLAVMPKKGNFEDVLPIRVAYNAWKSENSICRNLCWLPVQCSSLSVEI